MVLGVKSSKHKKKGPSIKLDYIVHVQEIKPWPPSESLKSVQTVLLQWENTDENSGSFISVAGESNIVFNESFMLPLTLYRRKKFPEKFKKTYLEFTLSEPRKDNKTKPQPLGIASINLADYGLLVEDVLTVSAPLVFKKNIPNCSVQSFLAISLELVEKDSSNDSSRLSHEASLDNDDEDSEITSYTDDDASSHSSRTAGSSTFELAIASPSLSEKVWLFYFILFFLIFLEWIWIRRNRPYKRPEQEFVGPTIGRSGIGRYMEQSEGLCFVVQIL
ncbi:PREDICTED: uncharacterized protein LOC105970846 [Erythranthe guttata]|uniref:uncharacterized protein LOC105970846 n=1 Tax=Erythranthe guttata TaxID=4155 RepID=UPI00064E0F00|nr:PREDICTED: uncharacterized protein LOC105970846 [Erythranthe guttata]|eukprot:XP_012851124.1 PREDICTED: uncharacterized protein LOC105970846 [Erythranthe guttata]